MADRTQEADRRTVDEVERASRDQVGPRRTQPDDVDGRQSGRAHPFDGAPVATRSPATWGVTTSLGGAAGRRGLRDGLRLQGGRSSGGRLEFELALRLVLLQLTEHTLALRGFLRLLALERLQVLGAVRHLRAKKVSAASGVEWFVD